VPFDIEHEIDDWTATVYDVILSAQQMGYGWSISGFIDEELNMTRLAHPFLGSIWYRASVLDPERETPHNNRMNASWNKPAGLLSPGF
jgi:hypothetical protein